MACRALVTGASRGIGNIAAEALAEAGCDLVVSARSHDLLSRAASETAKAYKVNVYPLRADLSVKGEAASLADKAISLLGGLEFVFMSYGNPPCEPCEPAMAGWDDWEYAFRMYVASPAEIMSRLVTKNPVKATVVLTSSFSSASPMWTTGVADVVRSSLPAMAKLYSRRYPDRLRVLVIQIGSFRTPGAERLVEQLSLRDGITPEAYWKERIASLSPLRRLGRPEELKDLIKWLLRSPEYMTGTAILFDGGSVGCA